MLGDQKWLSGSAKARLENMLKLKLSISRVAGELEVSRPIVYNAIEQYNGIGNSARQSFTIGHILIVISPLRNQASCSFYYM